MKAIMILALLALSGCGNKLPDSSVTKAFSSGWTEQKAGQAAVVAVAFNGIQPSDFNKNNGVGVPMQYMMPSGAVCNAFVILSGDPTSISQATITDPTYQTDGCSASISASILMNQTQNQLTICTYDPAHPGAQLCGNFY